MPPLFLPLDKVLEIHQDQVQKHGGSVGVRDMGLLQSALAMPRQAFGGQFVHSDLFEMAAAYLFHIVKNHPFVDGNKRVSATTAYIFLKLNGITLDPPEEGFQETVLAVAEGKLQKSGIAEFFRRHARR